MNAINNVYRYQNGFTGIGPELDPSRQHAQIESYGQRDVQRGSQKFLPKLPSPAFVDVISPPASHPTDGTRANEFSTGEEDEPYTRLRNFESNNANEFNVHEPVAVHVHNAGGSLAAGTPAEHNEYNEHRYSPVSRLPTTATDYEPSSRLPKETKATTVEQFVTPASTFKAFETTRNPPQTSLNPISNPNNPISSIGKHAFVWFRYLSFPLAPFSLSISLSISLAFESLYIRSDARALTFFAFSPFCRQSAKGPACLHKHYDRLNDHDYHHYRCTTDHR